MSVSKKTDEATVIKIQLPCCECELPTGVCPIHPGEGRGKSVVAVGRFEYSGLFKFPPTWLCQACLDDAAAKTRGVWRRVE